MRIFLFLLLLIGCATVPEQPTSPQAVTVAERQSEIFTLGGQCRRGIQSACDMLPGKIADLDRLLEGR